MEHKVYVKNSSSDVNYGYYDPKITIRTDGGRLYFDKKYVAHIACNEDLNQLEVIITEEKE